MVMLGENFFAQDAQQVAQQLLGKILRVKFHTAWLGARIIETEAYYLNDKGSHASLGYTEKRKALFMPAGTIYMYYARGGDSLNVSCLGEGNAVLIKAGFPYFTDSTSAKILTIMQRLNPAKNSSAVRPAEKLCAGQTLLCKALGLKVERWNQRQFDPHHFFIDDVGNRPNRIIQTTRLGIPPGRDEHLLYRFIDFEFANYCSQNPLTKRKWQLEKDYYILHIK